MTSLLYDQNLKFDGLLFLKWAPSINIPAQTIRKPFEKLEILLKNSIEKSLFLRYNTFEKS